MTTLEQAQSQISTLEQTQAELQNYETQLLVQLNEAEEKALAAASMSTSNDEQVEAAREALSSERDRLED